MAADVEVSERECWSLFFQKSMSNEQAAQKQQISSITYVNHSVISPNSWLMS